MKPTLLILLTVDLGIAAAVAQPVITNQPQNQTAIAGTTVTFSVGATGTPPLTYQWRRHTNAIAIGNIPGATNDTLVLTNVQPTSHRFGVIVTDGNGLSTNSNPLAQLIVQILPSFSLQPSNQSLSLGANARFLVAVANIHPPIRYQWQLAGTNLLNQTNTALNLSNVHLADAGDYTVLATDTLGSVTSRVAQLEIDPTFIKITTGSIVTAGGYSYSGAWGDYDNDGWIDLFVANGQYIGPDGTADFLYHNNRNGTFARITTGSVVTDGLGSLSGTWGDFNNDGFLDLFVCHGAGLINSLFQNNGDGTFRKITTGPIATDRLDSHSGVWGDFDNDGFLDLFVANKGTVTPLAQDVLYHNRGDGTFVAVFYPKPADSSRSWNAVWGDFDNDGDLDLFVSHSDFGRTARNQFYRNDGNGKLTELTNSILVEALGNSPGCAWGDYDNDGHLDLFVTKCFGQNNSLYHNNGDGTFTQITNSVVALNAGCSVGCGWGDYDNDGWLDLFVANEGPLDTNTFASIKPENNFLYHNNGDGTFSNISSGSLVNDGGYSTGCAWGDYDNDGFLDLFVANGWGTLPENDFLYRNHGNSNYWINFRLIGTLSNRAGIGAKVRVKATTGGRIFWQLRELSGGSNYDGQNDLRANFGLGDATNVDIVRIEWPSGTVQELHDVAARQFITMTEPPRLRAGRTNGEPQFSIEGRRGGEYRVDTTTNLTHWSLLGTVTITNPNGTARIIETNTPAGDQRFYRAVSR